MWMRRQAIIPGMPLDDYHGMGQTLAALLHAGLRIDAVEEYDTCEWKGLAQMVQGDDGYWRLPDRPERLPLMWSVLATRV